MKIQYIQLFTLMFAQIFACRITSLYV